MFDYLRSSYDLGEQFTNVILHTKDIEEGFGGTMTDYWLDPAGRLWCPQYHGTHTFEEIPEDDERYNERFGFLNFEWIPTGQHGRYQPFLLTKYIEIHVANLKGPCEDWPTLRLHFRHGVLQDFMQVKR